MAPYSKDDLAAYLSKRQTNTQGSLMNDVVESSTTLYGDLQGKLPRIETKKDLDVQSVVHESSYVNPTPQSPLPVARLDRPLSGLMELTDDSWRSVLKDFEESPGESVTPIWDRKFPIFELIDTHFCQQRDMEKIRKHGLHNTSQTITTFGVRSKSLSKLSKAYRERQALRKRIESVSKKIEESKVKLSKMSSQVEQELREVKTRIAELKEKFFLDGNVKLEIDIKAEKITRDAVESKLVKEVNEIVELKREMAYQYVAGFNKALDQVTFLYPDIDLTEVGPFKMIKDGKLVDCFVNPDLFFKMR
ncbi:hypothetical protein SESBI_14209 [Sesbania bispinosa]|nr:hypothetical protein SESBI_14209 [Sesbania bispinosa]